MIGHARATMSVPSTGDGRAALDDSARLLVLLLGLRRRGRSAGDGSGNATRPLRDRRGSNSSVKSTGRLDRRMGV